MFTEKGNKALFYPVYVPKQAWDYVSIDFLGPMTSGEYVLVVQDLYTKYPVAVLMKNGTTAKTTVKAREKIFTNLGRPTRYRSDNGPPFDSNDLTKYMESLDITKDPSYPFRPQSNPVETWIKPLGKCIKIAIKTILIKKLQLKNYF